MYHVLFFLLHSIGWLSLTLYCSPLQSWDNAIGNNVKSATKSGYVAMAFAVACGLYGAFTEYPKEE